MSALKEATVNGVCKINNGLTIGRLGYGSVFWPGSFELSNLNFDEIVHFRHKEVVVYPDESTKPEVGQELNQPAEVSLERVWPTDKQTRQSIKVIFFHRDGIFWIKPLFPRFFLFFPVKIWENLFLKSYLQAPKCKNIL